MSAEDGGVTTSSVLLLTGLLQGREDLQPKTPHYLFVHPVIK